MDLASVILDFAFYFDQSLSRRSSPSRPASTESPGGLPRPSRRTSSVECSHAATRTGRSEGARYWITKEVTALLRRVQTAHTPGRRSQRPTVRRSRRAGRAGSNGLAPTPPSPACAVSTPTATSEPRIALHAVLNPARKGRSSQAAPRLLRRCLRGGTSTRALG